MSTWAGCFGRGRVEEAVLQYEEALRLAQARSPASNLGTALEDLKRTNAAIAAYRRP
jgi:hypothetical protein